MAGGTRANHDKPLSITGSGHEMRGRARLWRDGEAYRRRAPEIAAGPLPTAERCAPAPSRRRGHSSVVPHETTVAHRQWQHT